MIFISYRREDSSGYAGRLFDGLRERFGQEQVFMDIQDIEPGMDFVDAIERAVGSCEALIVLIGRRWLDSATGAGVRRLDDPLDFVRLEISHALSRNIRVFPLLVQGAIMPLAAELPEELAGLARRQALDLSDNRWEYDMGRLVQVLERVIQPSSAPSVAARKAEPKPGAGAAAIKQLQQRPDLERIVKVDLHTWRWDDTFPAAARDIYRAALKSLQDLGMNEVLGVEPKQLTARTGISLRSFGEEVKIDLESSGEHETKVTVTSSSVVSTTLVDWGKNKQNIERILELLYRNVLG